MYSGIKLSHSNCLLSSDIVLYPVIIFTTRANATRRKYFPNHNNNDRYVTLINRTFNDIVYFILELGLLSSLAYSSPLLDIELPEYAPLEIYVLSQVLILRSALCTFYIRSLVLRVKLSTITNEKCISLALFLVLLC